MDEYLEKLLSQIRSKKARPFIEEEIRGHIEDQIAENLKNGMSRMKRGQQQYVIWEIPCRQASLWILSISRRPLGDFGHLWR